VIDMPVPHRGAIRRSSTLRAQGESAMRLAATDPIDRDAVRSVLEARRRRVIEDLRWRTARLRDETVTAPTDLDADVADDAADLDASLLEIATATLHLIDRALERLDNGHYGWCTRCHRRISAPRLRALPFAERCRECETEREDEARGRRRRAVPVPRGLADRVGGL
jgi:DnaK suppressor protein